ncbi:hypothetical protein P7C70_g6351, partial [Phenoliferia sp. Uapishka_3]
MSSTDLAQLLANVDPNVLKDLLLKSQQPSPSSTPRTSTPHSTNKSQSKSKENDTPTQQKSSSSSTSKKAKKSKSDVLGPTPNGQIKVVKRPERRGAPGSFLKGKMGWSKGEKNLLHKTIRSAFDKYVPNIAEINNWGEIEDTARAKIKRSCIKACSSLTADPNDVDLKYDNLWPVERAGASILKTARRNRNLKLNAAADAKKVLAQQLEEDNNSDIDHEQQSEEEAEEEEDLYE